MSALDDELVLVAVPMSQETLERIDVEVELKNDRTGGVHTRERLIRQGIHDLLDRLDGKLFVDDNDQHTRT